MRRNLSAERRLVVGVVLLGLASCVGGGRSCTHASPHAADRKRRPAVSAPAPQASPGTRTLVLVCPDGYEFVARIAEATAWVFLPEGTRALERTRATTGTRYGNGATTLWTRGQEARLEHAGTAHPACRNDPRRAVWEHAKLSGVDFRAVGNEPGWVLEIVGQTTIVLVTDYGARRYEWPLPEPSTDPRARSTRYETRDDTHTLIVELAARPCRDTMSGEAFETAVLAVLDGRELRGCGRPLH